MGQLADADELTARATLRHGLASVDDWKTAGIVAGVFVAGLGLLFGTGVVELGDDADADDDAAPTAVARAGSVADPPKARKGKSKGKGRRGGTPPKTGVTVNVEGEATPGLVLYNPSAWGRRYRKAARGKIFREARLIDTDGNELRAWSSDFASDTSRGWAMVRLAEDGSLYALNAREGFLKLSWDNELEWGTLGRYHHDFVIAGDSNIWVLTEQRRSVVVGGNEIALLDNGVSTLTPDGAATEQWWLYDALSDQEFFKEHLEARVQRRIDRAPEVDLTDQAMDLIQANSIEVLSRDVGESWKTGDVLVSLGALSMLVVLDANGVHKWHWGAAELDRQHDATVLANDHVLVFDNGFGRGDSKVMEIDPSDDNRVVWSYPNGSAASFFSKIRGSAQVLSSGNVFVVNSHRGRTLEVTREGKTVWEFYSPDILRGGLRLPFRMTKLEGKLLEATQQRLDGDQGEPGEG